MSLFLPILVGAGAGDSSRMTLLSKREAKSPHMVFGQSLDRLLQPAMNMFCPQMTMQRCDPVIDTERLDLCPLMSLLECNQTRSIPSPTEPDLRSLLSQHQNFGQA